MPWFVLQFVCRDVAGLRRFPGLEHTPVSDLRIRVSPLAGERRTRLAILTKHGFAVFANHDWPRASFRRHIIDVFVAFVGPRRKIVFLLVKRPGGTVIILLSDICNVVTFFLILLRRLPALIMTVAG